MDNGEDPLIAVIFAGIMALLIGWALATTPSPLQPAGFMIIVVGVAVLIATVLRVFSEIS